jgi:hypothetical protein
MLLSCQVIDVTNQSFEETASKILLRGEDIKMMQRELALELTRWQNGALAATGSVANMLRLGTLLLRKKVSIWYINEKHEIDKEPT